ncbi:hypothetical protein GDO81_018968 [Engystomops pustulosus]|uniref:C-type lectin domain-containing protein n=1 Tax=Engystomops pustulosus TaxID=76066 RepID=A0AAV6ZKV4_ENGPU|nr:hypothetical protein GDO81_018968 [Engystomops pustulosus]
MLVRALAYSKLLVARTSISPARENGISRRFAFWRPEKEPITSQETLHSTQHDVVPLHVDSSGWLARSGPKGEKGDISVQSATLASFQNKLSSLEARVNQLQLSISKMTKALLFARGAIAGEKTFVTSGKELTYEQSNSICQKAGGQLASPKNSEENTAVLEVAQHYGLFPFMGITDIQTEGIFRYSDGKSLVYSNWSPGEPNQSGEEDCVEMQLNGKWNDKSCKEKRLIICEFQS